MHKLPEVQAAKELMKEAMEWSAFKWLFEKTRVRQTADRANEALDRLNRSVKARWSDEIKAEYKELKHRPRKDAEEGPGNAGMHALLEKVIAADEAAHRARMAAEDTFDQAEKQMSTSLAAEGCKKAVHSWTLHEKAIRQAEAVEQGAQTPDAS